jgi:hypothetical protein
VILPETVVRWQTDRRGVQIMFYKRSADSGADGYDRVVRFWFSMAYWLSGNWLHPDGAAFGGGYCVGNEQKISRVL